MKLIDKDKVVAEIKGRLSLLEGGTGHPEVMKRVEGVIKGYKSILTFLDTLETKEGDLEKEIEDYIYTLPHSRTGIPGGWKCSWSEKEVIKIVKHFLNLD